MLSSIQFAPSTARHCTPSTDSWRVIGRGSLPSLQKRVDASEFQTWGLFAAQASTFRISKKTVDGN